MFDARMANIASVITSKVAYSNKMFASSLDDKSILVQRLYGLARIKPVPRDARK